MIIKIKDLVDNIKKEFEEAVNLMNLELKNAIIKLNLISEKITKGRGAVWKI